jgi:pyroglutamyl-peptidase
VITVAKKLLVTGFGAFRDIDVNPSSWLAEQLAGLAISTLSGITYQVLEVSYAAVDDFLAGLDSDSFDIWLMIGVHGNAERMHLETVGRNVVGAGADVRGVVAGPGMIDPSMPPAVSGTLFDAGCEGEHACLTVDAGGYLCNYLYFQGLARFPEKRIGFLHVPRVEMMDLADQLVEVRRITSALAS